MVSVVIISHNSAKDIRQCIKSLNRQTYRAKEVYLLDNASSDKTQQIAEEFVPNITIIQLNENLGFANGHNYGMRITDLPYYMPINPDMVLEENYVEEMVLAMESSPDVGMVSGKLLFMTADGEKTDRIYTTGHLLPRSRAPANRGYKQKDVGQFENLEMIFAANGAAPLYRREMLEDVSIDNEFFCKDFFMYGEDHDLGWRAQLQGWKCAYTPKAIGYHIGFGNGAIRNFYIQSQFTRNRYLTLVRNDQLTDFVIDLPFILAYELIWQAYTLLRTPKRILAHWIGILQAIGATRKTFRARKEIQQRRGVERRYIRSFFVSKLW